MEACVLFALYWSAYGKPLLLFVQSQQLLCKWMVWSSLLLVLSLACFARQAYGLWYSGTSSWYSEASKSSYSEIWRASRKSLHVAEINVAYLPVAG
jgi:hypothetical protein